jgi:hypothetical protein
MCLLFEVGLFAARFVPRRESPAGEGAYTPPTDAEQEAELDRIDAEERNRSPR